MSVLIPDLKVYNYILNGLQKSAYRSVIDEYYSHCMVRHFESKDIDKESKRLVKSWLDMNHKSYQYRYEDGKEEASLWQFITKEIVYTLKPLQLLKYIQCVLYNIELDTIKDGEGEVTKQQEDDFKLLDTWREELAFSIINKIPEYDQAKWSEAV